MTAQNESGFHTLFILVALISAALGVATLALTHGPQPQPLRDDTTP